jgi:hypothetical protein
MDMAIIVHTTVMSLGASEADTGVALRGIVGDGNVLSLIILVLAGKFRLLIL